MIKPFDPPQLTYWLREEKSANAEVDYVIASGARIMPIEVKAGKSGALKSLQQFALNKQISTCIRFDLNPPGTGQIKHSVRVKN